MRDMTFAAVLVASLLGTQVSVQEYVVIERTTLVSPHLDAPLTNTSILIQDGRIMAVGGAADLSVPDEARRIDGRGKWVTPGIVEFHSHAISAPALRSALALGVTTAQTVARPESPMQHEELSHAPATPSPRLVLITGYVGEFMERMGAQEVSKPQTVEEARKDVLAMHRNGARAVKIWQDDGSLWFDSDRRFPPVSADVFDALVQAGHDAGMRVVVHAWRLPFFRDALDAGVDPPQALDSQCCRQAGGSSDLAREPS